ncbi:MAG: hypothetical protein ACR2JM_01875 [Mycobacterium sp.]
MDPERFAEVLADHIASLESQMAALQPEWPMPSLQRSYVNAAVYAALTELYGAA